MDAMLRKLRPSQGTINTATWQLKEAQQRGRACTRTNTNSSTNDFPPLSSIAHVISKTACMLQDPCHGRRRTTVVTHHIHVTAILLTKAQFTLQEALVLSSRRAFMHVVGSQ
jgi:hypothetical protein